MIPLYKTVINKKTIQNVNSCLKSTWISSKGHFVKKFEKSFSNFTKIKHSVSVCNGTVAIHLALLALGIKKNDEVIVPSFTYIASVNPIKYVNANPIFIDSDYKTFQINLKDLEKKITNKTKAIICPHLYGNIADMDTIKKICLKKKIFIIEDCAEALGSYYKKFHAGNFGHIATFSFYGNKTISTGEGGMVCTNNQKLSKIVLKLKSQGISNPKKYYYHDIIGYNYRMTNICAAIGLSQISEIKSIIKKKRKIYLKYKKGFKKNNNILLLGESKNVLSSFWLNVILLKNMKLRNKLMNYLKKEKIETRPTFCEIHKMPMYRIKKNFFNSKKLSETGLCLPSYPNIKLSYQKKIIYRINRFFNEN